MIITAFSITISFLQVLIAYCSLMLAISYSLMVYPKQSEWEM